MWFMNKIANPIVKLILSSPMHRLMDQNTLLICYRGRKSGKLFTLPVQYVKQGSSFFIIPGFAEKKTWWRNLRCGAEVRLLLHGKWMKAQAGLLDCEMDEALAASVLDSYFLKFPPSARGHAVTRGSDGHFVTDGLIHAAQSMVIVRASIQ